jgi:hypothetical protein
MMLAALRIAFEEFDDRRIRAERLNQLDLAVGRIDEADPNGSRTTSAPIRSRYSATERSIDGVATPTWLRRPSFMISFLFRHAELVSASIPSHARPR